MSDDMDGSELLAIRDDREDNQPVRFGSWWRSCGQVIARGALFRIATRRGQFGFLSDESFVADVMIEASLAAWRSIMEYRHFCPVCLRHDGQHGACRAVSFCSVRGLRKHMLDRHAGMELPDQSSEIERRVHYLIGSRIGTVLRSEARRRKREAGTYSISRCTGKDARELVCHDSMERLLAIETMLDRERKLASSRMLERRDRLSISMLMSGMPLDDLDKVCSGARRRLRRIRA